MPKKKINKEEFASLLGQGASSSPLQSSSSNQQQLLQQAMTDPAALVHLQDTSIPMPQKPAVPNLEKSEVEKAFNKKDRLDVREQKALLRAANDPTNLEKGLDGKWQISKKVENVVKDTLRQNAMHELTGGAVGKTNLKEQLQQKGMLKLKPTEGLKRQGAFKARKIN